EAGKGRLDKDGADRHPFREIVGANPDPQQYTGSGEFGKGLYRRAIPARAAPFLPSPKAPDQEDKGQPRQESSQAVSWSQPPEPGTKIPKDHSQHDPGGKAQQPSLPRR